MAKRKAKPAPVVLTEVAGLSIDDTQRFHGFYTPHWRPMLDCGEGTFEDVQAAILATIEEFAPQGAALIGSPVVDKIALEWKLEPQGVWLAYGSDGVIETNLPIARIEAVKS